MSSGQVIGFTLLLFAIEHLRRFVFHAANAVPVKDCDRTFVLFHVDYLRVADPPGLEKSGAAARFRIFFPAEKSRKKAHSAEVSWRGRVSERARRGLVQSFGEFHYHSIAHNPVLFTVQDPFRARQPQKVFGVGDPFG